MDIDKGVPSHDTYNRFFSHIDAAAIADITEGRVVSIDGKTLRGSKGSGKDHFIHMVSAWCNANELVLGQQKVDGKSNEISAIPELLELLVLKGCIVTIDAIGCQQSIAEKIVDRQADYILAVKDNQKFLHQDLQDAFENEKSMDQYKASNVGHGRIESRCTTVITNLDWVCKAGNWKGLQSLIRVVATREDKKTGEKQSASRYYISSKKAPARFFHDSIPSHWSIENKLHWSLDVSFGEDNSKKQAANSTQNFSLFSKIALNMIRHHKLDDYRGAKKISIKRKRKMAGWSNDYLIGILLSYEPT